MSLADIDETQVVICEGWDAAVAAKPDDYQIEIVYGRNGYGYVKYEPPSRPGNRGPRRPRYVEGFGWPVDGHPNVGSALMALSLRAIEEGDTTR